MFNEHGMTSRQSFSSRLYVDLEEGSANPASSAGGGLAKLSWAANSLRGTDILAQQGSPASTSSSCRCPLCLSGQSPKELRPQRDVLAAGRLGCVPGPSLEHTATLSCSTAPRPGVLQHPGNWKGLCTV